MKSIITQITNAKQKVQDLTNAFIMAKSDLIRQNIETQVDEYDKLLKDLELQKSKLELERGCRPTKKDLLEYIGVIIAGDKADKEYQRNIIDNLVLQVIVNDSETIVLLNIDKDRNTELLTTDDISKLNNELSNTKSFRTQSPMPRQSNRVLMTKIYIIFLLMK